MLADNVGLFNMPFGDLELHGHSNIFFLRVNQSCPGTSSTTNHIFYRALVRLHGPWCKYLQKFMSFKIQKSHDLTKPMGPNRSLHSDGWETMKKVRGTVWMKVVLSSNDITLPRFQHVRGASFLGWSHQSRVLKWALYLLFYSKLSPQSRPCAVIGRGLRLQRVDNKRMKHLGWCHYIHPHLNDWSSAFFHGTPYYQFRERGNRITRECTSHPSNVNHLIHLLIQGLWSCFQCQIN
jgi:hypothetical protein